MDSRNSLIFSIVEVLMRPKDADGPANSESPDLGCLVLCVQFFKLFTVIQHYRYILSVLSIITDSISCIDCIRKSNL